MEPGEARNPLSQLRRGALEYCVLALLRERERYGFELVRSLSAVDGLVTGWHEPDSSHLLLLEASLGLELLRRSYDAAAGGYRFHEFGDVQLIEGASRRA